MLLSCIIPSFKDPMLHKTIDSILENSGLGDELEIIVGLDSYWPKDPIKNDNRIKILHSTTNLGMRDNINQCVAVAQGKYIARFDEHIMVCKDWDKILLENIEDNWIVSGLRYFLDPDKWEVVDKPPIEAEKLIIDKDRKKFAAVRCGKPEGDIFEVTAHQGSFWIMPKKLWDDVIGELQTEGYGPLYQDSIEMVFKIWKAGGKLMRNNKMWYAHKDRTFRRTHNITGEESQKSFDYARELWEPYFLELKEQWKKT